MKSWNWNRNSAVAALALLTLLLLPHAPLMAGAADADVAGEWAVEFRTRFGRGNSTMALAQTGTRVRGYLTSARGETPVNGTIEGDKFRVVWEQPMDGEIVQITVEAIVDGDSMTGTVRFADYADGPFYAERR